MIDLEAIRDLDIAMQKAYGYTMTGVNDIPTSTPEVDPEVLKLYEEIRAHRKQMVELKALYDETGDPKLLEIVLDIARIRTSKLIILNSNFGALSNYRKGI